MTEQKPINSNIIKEQVQIFKAMANETRLKILHLLNEGEKSVNQLVEELGNKERTGVSKHLNLLKELKLIDYREEGVKRFYSLKALCLLEAAHCTLDLAKQGCCNS